MGGGRFELSGSVGGKFMWSPSEEGTIYRAPTGANGIDEKRRRTKREGNGSAGWKPLQGEPALQGAEADATVECQIFVVLR